MLILTRRKGQSVVIGSDITITVTEIAGAKIRVSVEAPEDVKILRGELTGKEEAK